MLLNRIELRDFRNYARQVSEFSPRVNIFFGANAQGKTNLLESIYLLGLGRSFRTPQDRELIRQDTAGFRIVGSVEGRDFPLNPSTMEMAYDGSRKALRLNGVLMRRQSELLGLLRLVLFAPEDLQIVKGGPVNRRRFVDIGLAQSSRKYRDALYRYTEVLAQRNRLLHDQVGGRPAMDVLETWDEQLIEYGAKVIEQRVKGLNRLAPVARKYHSELSARTEDLTMEYSFGTGKTDMADEDADWGQALRESLRRHRAAELARGVSLVGPHRDDVILGLKGQGELRVYGSQGQARTATLALKMAMVDFISGETGDYPLLLLDDVLSEFDDERKKALLQTVMGVTQTFITTTSLEYFSPGPEMRLFKVERGVVSQWPV